jgi:hypothetical protein
MNIESENCVSKKKGRKKKETEEIEQEEKIKKKRGRKKKWESFSNVKLVISDTEEDNIIKFNEKHKIEKTNNYNEENVLFGNLNIVVHTNKDNNNINIIQTDIKQNIYNENNKAICKIELSNSDIEEEDDLVQVYSTEKLNEIKVLKMYEDIYDKGKEINRTDILCYHCCHQFYNKPVLLPIDYNEQLKRYKVFGNFCSVNCAKTYALEDKILNKKIYLLSQMYKQINGYNYKIKPAPPKYCLKSFGGTLTIEEFRKNFTNNKFYNIVPMNTKIILMNIN